MTDNPSGSTDPYAFTDCEDGDDFATRAIHAGESPVASAFPVYQANTVGGLYARMRNPTIEALEEKVRVLEGGAATLALSSGMAAVSHTLLGLLRSGDRIVVHESVFIGVKTLLADFVAGLGIEVVRVDLNDAAALARALETPAQLVYFEPFCNPTLEVVNAPAVIAAARQAGVPVAVDNTILTPCLFRPLALGADLVIHSGTKYLSGHGDVLAGFVTFADAGLGRKIHKARRILGGLLSPQSAFLVMRGLKTLPLRIERHCRNALEVAEFLAGHPAVKSVAYPGLASARGHAVARSFASGFGGLLSFEPAEQLDVERFLGAVRLCRPWMSFGEVASRVQHEGPIRLSVGLESAADLLRDLDQAFAAALSGSG